MGKTIEKAKLWNILDNPKIASGEKKPLEVDAQVDNGAVRLVLPKKIADALSLEIRGKSKVRYADMRVAERDVAFGVMIQILGRETETTAIVEPDRDIPLIGQIILEDLDLLIDSKNGRLIPNPASPDMPMLDEF